MIPKLLKDVKAEDIDALVTNRIREGDTIDFKQALPDGSNRESVKFLKHVTALTNTRGGDIVFGMKEKEAIAEEVIGLDPFDADEIELKLRNLVLNGVEPSLAGVEIRAIDGFEHGRSVMVVRVPLSWARPHAVARENHFRFYGRHGNVSFPMSVHDLRAAFAMTDELPRRIRAFREERIQAMVDGKGPIPELGSAQLLIHVVPASAVDPTTSVDIQRLEREPQLLPVIGGASYSRFNLDGFVHYLRNDRPGGYALMFRRGALEALMPPDSWQSPERGKWYSPQVEEALVQYLPRYVNTVDELTGNSRPILVMVTLIGVQGLRLGMGPEHDTGEDFSFDRAVIPVPEAVVEDEFHLDDVVDQIMDGLWQCSGLSERREWARVRR